ncbi:sugar kinase [Oleomonas cavernae]|uniref:Sugar kinase n=1 Tax=Oleomonas cavernae TaxID=2320859 RepID=A0A418W9W0_9PROT|nr:sugar kinase [Oleomonas cavernae]RJF86817.1 sugar kinase [Oleomonas cavernae]
MTTIGDCKIVLVVRPTRLDDLITRFNTVQQAQFYVEHLGADFSDYLMEQRRYREAAARAEAALKDLGRVQRLERRYLSNFVFAPEDRVVVLGQDGLVANTLKYLDGQRVVGVNPDPGRWDGVLLPFTVDDLPGIMREELAGRRQVKTVRMAQATLNTGQTLHAVNDLFIGQRTHCSARYRIAIGDRAENQSSSGVIVSTGLGSTGWMRSIYAGWAGATRSLVGALPADVEQGPFSWDAPHLHYYVREPYPSRTTGADIVIGRVTAGDRLSIVSQMPENGVIFSDGIENDYIEFGSGVEASIRVADKAGSIVV